MSWFVLKEGEIQRSGKGVLFASSSIVFSDYELNCVIDTGLPENEEEIVSELKKLGYETEDIDLVINTHLHHDHIGCNHLFDDAKKIKGLSGLDVKKSVEKNNKKISNRLKIIETPGHTRNHISVEIMGEEGKVIVAGDALPEKKNYTRKKPPGINFDEEISLESIDKIVEEADIVVPGHDAPFRINKN